MCKHTQHLYIIIALTVVYSRGVVHEKHGLGFRRRFTNPGLHDYDQRGPLSYNNRFYRTVHGTVRYHQNLFQIKLPGHEMISLKHETEILYSASALIRHCATLLTHVLGAKCCTVAWNQPHAGLKI